LIFSLLNCVIFSVISSSFLEVLWILRSPLWWWPVTEVVVADVKERVVVVKECGGCGGEMERSERDERN
jgi:hypothetical protein